MEGKMWANLSIITFDMILNLMLAMEIGLYYSLECALLDLVMRIRVLTLKLDKIHPWKKNLVIALISSTLTTSQKDWYK